MKKPAISVTHLTASYDDTPVLFDVSLAIPQGVICAVVGPNGAGKSTFIKSLVNLVKPVAGTISLFGESFAMQRDALAYIPQHRSVDWDFPLTVLDIVLMGRYRSIGWFKRPGKKDIERAQHALRLVHLEAYADRHISQLSGGQRQRVFLARALVHDARLYLMDEPFVGVDAVTERMIVDVLKRLRSQGKTILVVHHDLQLLQEYFDWLVLLNTSLVACGPLQEVLTKKNIRASYGAIPSFLCLKEE